MSKSKTRQFYCYKFNTKRLKKSNYEITTNFNKAKQCGEIIAISDNQILRTIRDIKGIVFNKETVENLYRERDWLRNQPSSSSALKKIKEIQEQINHQLFYPEYVTITIDKMSHYDEIIANGLMINGMLYERLSCSAGQARSSTVLMCSVDIIDDVKKVLNNNRDESVKIAPSKFNAYFGLYSSATFVVREPRFCVVPDYENETTFKVNYVTEAPYDLDDSIEVKTITQKMNRTDGMGLISPEMAKQWSEDLNLDYIPSQFIIRQSFLKGLVTVFDFVEFCKEKNNENYFITDIYGDIQDLRECDLIVSESQFKLWNAYKSTEAYVSCYRSNNIKWGVAQYAPKEYDDSVFLNYQFIQSLDLNINQIKQLCSPFKKWVEGVSVDDIYYTLLFLVGQNTSTSKIREYLKSWEIDWIKALMVNHSLLNDKYIREKIYKYLLGAIKRAYLGRIPVKGNFQYLVTDPYAYMEHVCGLEVKGLLGKDEHYSNYWNGKGVSTVDAMRAPLTHFSEHTILHLKKNEETEKWYKWCKNGIIINWFGYEVCKFAGADYDGDIVCTTSNPTIIEGVIDGEYPVVYDPPKPEKVEIKYNFSRNENNQQDIEEIDKGKSLKKQSFLIRHNQKTLEELYVEGLLVKFDKFGMGSIIGQITNKGAAAYAILPILKNKFGEDSEEVSLTLLRLKETCCAQSKQIDKTKIGREVKGIPKCWYEKDYFQEGDFNTINNNSLLNKRPYFFKYLYDESKSEYKNYKETQDYRCKKAFKLPLETVLSTDEANLTKDQKQFIEEYYERSPLIISDSCMNMLCRYIEDIDFNLKKKIRTKTAPIDYTLLKNLSVEYTKSQRDRIIKKLKDFNKWYSANSTVVEGDGLKYSLLEDQLYEVENNIDVITNVIVDYCYKEEKGNKDLVWNFFSKQVFNNLMVNNNAPILCPVPNENGDIEYMGKRFSLEEVNLYE